MAPYLAIRFERGKRGLFAISTDFMMKRRQLLGGLARYRVRGIISAGASALADERGTN
jgi:hypothetical protein